MSEGKRYMEELIEEQKLTDDAKRKKLIIDLKFKASVLALHIKLLQEALEKL